MAEKEPRIKIPTMKEIQASEANKKVYAAAKVLKDKAHLIGMDIRAPLIIEIGTRWTRYGLGGEHIPQGFTPSVIKNPKTGKLHHVFDSTLPLDEQEAILYVHLKKVIAKNLLNAPGERRIVIVESLFAKAENRQLLAKILFDRICFKMPSIMFVPSPLMNVLPWGTSTALVIDIGYNSTTVFPVYDTIIVFNAYTETGVGAKDLIARVRDYITTQGKVRNHDGSYDAFGEEDIKRFDDLNLAEDIVTRFLMVTQKSRGRVIQAKEHLDKHDEEIQFAPDIEMPFGTRKYVIPGYIREAAAECFFTEEGLTGSLSIAQIALQSVTKAPIDMRRPLLNNIIVTGSVACLPGMLGRFKVELQEELKEPLPHLVDEIKFLTLPHNGYKMERYSSWLGGSLFGEMEDLGHRTYTKEHWATKKPLPDWTNFIDDYKVPQVPNQIVRENTVQVPLLNPQEA